MKIFVKCFKIILLFFLLTTPAFAAINTDKLSETDATRAQALIEKLEPLIKEREAQQSLATLSFDELYTPLNEEEKAFLKEFQDLKGEPLGVSIPYRGIATGKEDLVVLKHQDITMKEKPFTIPPQYLPPHVYLQYTDMIRTMERDLGKRLYVESGYRSSAYQLYLFVYYLKNHDYSVKETTHWVALPGYSEHGAPEFQAIDFISSDGISGEENPQKFENLEEYRWLWDNAGRFGFILSYPKDKPGITFEPWHWRYEEASVSEIKPPQLLAAPSTLPFTDPAMLTPGFWISRLSKPDKFILDSKQINELNRYIQNELKLIVDVLKWPNKYSGKDISEELTGTLNDIKNKNLVTFKGTPFGDEFYTAVTAQMLMKSIPKNVKRQYGIIVKLADQRLLPTEEGMYAKAFDMDFDELQNSNLDIGTPLIVLHTSQDGKWFYATSPSSRGWIKAKDIALIKEKDLKKFLSSRFIITTAAKTDIYLDKELTKYHASVRMGVQLPLDNQKQEISKITIPVRQRNGSAEFLTGYVENEHISEGYLPLTPRFVIKQAFKLLHHPYGWGGMYEAQDCSAFLQEIFAVFGLEFPRNSKDQIQVGTLLGTFDETAPDYEKLSILKSTATGGATILGMKGHIMLYLGSMDDKAYAIHAVYAYRKPGYDEDNTMVLNKVTVSDLSLGEGSKRGSLLKRINAIRSLGFNE